MTSDSRTNPVQKNNDQPAPLPIMPANVRAGQILGLVEITGGLGGPVDAAQLADEFGADLVTLLPILDTGEQLGLVKVDKGVVSLTDFGLKFQKASKYKVRMLKDQLSKIEPFRTALALAQEKGEVSTAEICEALQAKNIRWHHSADINETIVHTLLIHWAIYAGLLTYGKTGKFQRV